VAKPWARAQAPLRSPMVGRSGPGYDSDVSGAGCPAVGTLPGGTSRMDPGDGPHLGGRLLCCCADFPLPRLQSPLRVIPLGLRQGRGFNAAKLLIQSDLSIF